MSKQKIYLSNSSIQTFLSCRRKFKYKHIDKIKFGQNQSNKYLSFGQSIHTALGKYHLIQDSQYKTLEILHKLLKKNWIRDGYSSIDEERIFGLKALDMLTNYFNNPKDLGKRNLLIEEMVYKNIDDKFILCGKLDKVYLREDETLETVDYKTGESILPVDNLQLPIYILLTQDKVGFFPHTVSYYYLAHNKKSSSEVEEKDIDNILQLIWHIRDEIDRETDFPCNPTPRCQKTCEYYVLCDAAKKGQTIMENELKDLQNLDDSNIVF